MTSKSTHPIDDLANDPIGTSAVEKNLLPLTNSENTITETQLEELTANQLPKRSVLYPIKPLGLGTPFVESMTSYITRLAEAHSVKVMDFFTHIVCKQSEVILPHFRYHPGPGTFYNNIRNNPSKFIGMGKNAFYTVNALEKLTHQKHLKYLTTLPLRKVISEHSLLRKNSAYCWVCFREWYDQGKPLYEPLAWKFEIVKQCPYHGAFLLERCPKCDTPVPHLYPKRKIGWCHHCGEWLGFPFQRHLQKLTPEEVRLSTFPEGGKIGKLLFAIQNKLTPIRTESINKFLSKLIVYVDGRDVENAGWSGPYPPELKVLKKYPLKIEMGALDYICRCFDISWVDFFQDISVDISDPRCQIPTDLVLATNPRYPNRIGWRWEKKCYREDLPQASKYLRYVAENLKEGRDWEFLLRDLKQKVENGEVG